MFTERGQREIGTSLKDASDRLRRRRAAPWGQTVSPPANPPYRLARGFERGLQPRSPSRLRGEPVDGLGLRYRKGRSRSLL